MMNPANENVAELPDWFSPDRFHTVVVAFPDVYARLVGKRITRNHFVREVMANGAHACNYLLVADIEMNPLPGFSLASWEKGFGDFHVKVDLSTLRPVPWLAGTALVLGDLDHEDGRPVLEAPRHILRRQLERLAERDLAAYMASELEFHLFQESFETAHEQGYSRLKTSSTYPIDYHLVQTSRDEELLARIRNEMDEAGVTIEGSKGEWGQGQHEVNLLYTEAMQMADRHAVFKHGTKEIAAQAGRSVTFMAKWATEAAGSSCHLHSSLRTVGGNDVSETQTRFADEKGHPNPLFRQFLGGLLKYSRELSYFFAPTANAFKRFQVGSWAPTSLVWAYDNRTTGFRVVGHGDSLRIENRMPGADANPYLAMAATVVAGLRGVDENLDCGDAYKGNAYADSSLPCLPASLQEAAELLNRSELARECFGNDIVDFYVHTARLEHEAYVKEVSDWERRRYFERI